MEKIRGAASKPEQIGNSNRRLITRRKALGVGLFGAASLVATVARGKTVSAYRAVEDFDNATNAPKLLSAQESVQTQSILDVSDFIPHKLRVTLAEENTREGDTGWQLTRPDASIASFIEPHSVVAGEKLNFHIATGEGKYNLNLYRLGWYGGKGGRKVYQQEDINCPPITTATDKNTRTVIGTWDASASITVPDDWRSGVYVAVATSKIGFQCMAPFWIKSTGERAPILAESGLLTYAAYNSWKGSSLYDWALPRASSVSLDRPFDRNGGSGDLLVWENPFFRFLERSGLDADYQTDLDSHNDPNSFEGHKLIVLVGHHEYYTNEMRQRLDEAVLQGKNIALFGANAGYMRVRLEESTFGKNRRIVCYKNDKLDPVADRHLATIRFRDEPFSHHEAELFGIAYEQTNPDGDDFVVQSDIQDHWVFKGTGLQNGDKVKSLVGPEYDAMMPGVPVHGIQIILAASQVNVTRGKSTSYSSIVTHDSGAAVFATGSLNWNKGLDAYRAPDSKRQIPEDTRVQILAHNVLSKLS